MVLEFLNNGGKYLISTLDVIAALLFAPLYLKACVYRFKNHSP
jgi:hypothetical protein